MGVLRHISISEFIHKLLCKMDYYCVCQSHPKGMQKDDFQGKDCLFALSKLINRFRIWVLPHTVCNLVCVQLKIFLVSLSHNTFIFFFKDTLLQENRFCHLYSSYCQQICSVKSPKCSYPVTQCIVTLITVPRDCFKALQRTFGFKYIIYIYVCS